MQALALVGGMPERNRDDDAVRVGIELGRAAADEDDRIGRWLRLPELPDAPPEEWTRR